MAVENLKLLVNEVVNSPAQIAQRQPDAINKLNTVYRELFNETIQQGCGNCYQKAFYRIQKYLFNNKIKMAKVTERKYLLKDGASLQTEFGGDILTNDNLTDDQAEKLLKKFPVLVKHFERYPDSAKPAEAKEKVKAPTAAEIKTFLESLSAEQKPEFLAGVKAAVDAKGTLVIKVGEEDRELTTKQLEKIAEENTPAE